MTIYDLKLHESMVIEVKSSINKTTDYFDVVRVPGGWIYRQMYIDLLIVIFIPFTPAELC